MLSKIVTHPGGSHKDEFLALCVLMAKSGAPVERREPTEADLADPTVAVVDVGGQHNSALMNFDHHHFPREHAPTCSISLVLQHYGLYKDALLFCPWLEVAEWFDSRGPNKTAQWLGIGRDVVAKMNSPIDITLLRRFAACTQLAPGQPLYEVMRFVGEDLISYLENVRSQIDSISKLAVHWTVAAEGGPIEAVFLPRTESTTDDSSSAVAAYIRSAGLEKKIAAMVYPDRRGGGFGIARYEDHPRLDFSRMEAEPDVHFAHKSGFVLKTSATEPARLQALLLGGWR